MNKGFMILLSALFFHLGLLAQPINTECLSITEFQVGTVFGASTGYEPGSVFFSENGLSLSVEEYMYPDSTFGFDNGQLLVDEADPFLNGTHLRLNNIGLGMDFSGVEGAVTEVTFSYSPSPDLNVSVNGSPLFLVNPYFNEFENLNIPGVEITTMGFFDSFQITFSGSIESLIIGGDNFGVGSICYTTVPCAITNLSVETLACNEDGSYDLAVDFDPLNTSNDTSGFDVIVNGEQVAFIEPGTSLPFTVTGIIPVENGDADGNLTFLEASGPFTQIPFSGAEFGPAVPASGLAGVLVNAVDGTVDPSMVCEGVVNENDVEGRIALIDRGVCVFEQKAVNAEAAGAIGVIICNFEDELIEMAGTANIDDPSIPTVMLGASDCEFIRIMMEEDSEVNVMLQPSNAVEGFELTVCVNDNPDCCASVSVEPECPEEQPENCIGFEGLPSGEIFGSGGSTQPGTVFYTESGVEMFLLPYQTLFWTTTYGNVFVVDEASHPEMGAAIGNYLQFESVNIGFDLTGYSEPIDSITLDFYYTGGGINLAANGAAFLIQNNLAAGFYALAPGITVQVVYTSGNEGQMTFIGNLQSLLIGGEGDFRIDNLCINPTQECMLDNLVVEASPCNPNNVFTIDLDFDYFNTTDTFGLNIGNQFEGYFAYADLPITLSPIVGPTDTLSFEVFDYGNNDCSATATLLPVDCNDCPLEIVNLVGGPDCIGFGEPFYYVSLEVVGAEVGDTLEVSSLVTGETYTVYYDGQINLEFFLTPAGFDELQICLVNSSASVPCCVNIAYDIGCPLCEITDLVLEPYCDGDSLFYFDIDFEAIGIFTDTFVLDLENGFHAEFAYADLPVTLGPVAATGEVLFAWLFDDQGLCGTNTFFQTPDCEDGCVLGAISLPTGVAGCNNDGTYNIPIGIENAEIGDLFYVQSTVTGYADTIAYGSAGAFFLQLSNWPTPEDQVEELQICLWEQPNCCVQAVFDVPCEVSCDLEAAVELLSCDPNGVMTFELSTTSTSQNAGPFVAAIINGQFYGLFGINTTVEIGQIVNDGSFDVLEVEVQLWENQSASSCSVFVPVDVSGCASDCEIPGFEVSLGGCNGFGGYVAILDFDTDSLANQTLDIYANGNLMISNASPLSTAINVDPYNPGSSPDVITACYTNDPDCCESIEIIPPNCYCSFIEFVEASVGPCDNNGTYSVDVELELEIDFGQAIFVEMSNGFFGVYQYSDFPITVGGLFGEGEIVEVVVYQDGECNPDYISYLAPECGVICELPQVDIEVNCGNASANLVFEFSDIPPGNNWYTLEIPGLNLSESFFINEPFTFDTIIPFPFPNLGVDVILCNTSIPNCCEVYTVEIDCGPDCDIEATSVFPVITDCVNGFYTNTIFVNGLEVGDTVEVYSVFSNFTQLGYANSNGELIVNYTFPIPPGGQNDLIIICDVNSPNCCTEVFVEIDCGINCGINEVLWTYECLSADSLILTIDSIITFGNPSGPYTVEVEGHGAFTFELSDLPLTIWDITLAPNQATVEFLVSSTTCPDTFITSFTPDCGIAGCLFTSVIAEPFGCNDGQFMVDVQVNVNEPGPLGYYVFADGQIFGPYSYNQAFVTIGPLVGDGTTIYDILILDIADPSCFGYTEVGPVNCENEPCSINDLVVTAGDCNAVGIYGITIDFNTNVNENTFFHVYGSNGQQLGFYPVFALPVTIQGIEVNGTGINEILVCLNNSTNCCEGYTVLEPVCPGECLIDDVTVAFAYCDTSGFYVQLDFDVQDPTANTYLVAGNGQLYGTYSYNTPPPVIGPFDPFTDNIYELIVQDTEDAACSGFVEFPAFDCNNGVCSISNLSVIPEGCDEEGSYAILIDFDVVNPVDDLFEVNLTNGVSLGLFPIAELPLLIEGVQPPPNGGQEFVNVCINNAIPYCCDLAVITPPLCVDECNISGLTADFAYCDTAGYYMQLSFEVVNPEADGYGVIVNGMDYGNYSYNEPFPAIGPFESDENIFYELIVFDLENDNCSDFTAFDGYDCEEINALQCLDLDNLNHVVYNLENGFSNGDVLFEFLLAEVSMITEGDTCNICSVEVAPAVDYPEFTTAEGNLLVLNNAGLTFDFGNTNGLTQQVYLEFNNQNDNIWIGVNGGPIQPYSFLNFLHNVTDEVEIVIQYGNNGYGAISLTGPIETFSIFSGPAFEIDNICISEFEENNSCIEFIALDQVLEDTAVIVADFFDPNGMYLEEDGVIMTSTTIPEWFGETDYFYSIFGYSTDLSACNFQSEGGHLQVIGAIDFDFSMLSNYPDQITMDIGSCNFTSNLFMIYLEINGESITASYNDFPITTGGTIVNIEQLGNTDQGILSISGLVEQLVVGGSLRLDNICFSEQQLITEVWPGDANNDNIAHHVDLLNIGIAYGETGPQRAIDGTGWMGVDALDWSDAFANGLNYKHADCNGDGIVDVADRVAIFENYNLTHGPAMEIESLPYTDVDPPIFVDFDNEMPEAATFNVPIIAGTAESPIEDIYGLAFTIEFDPELIPAESIDIVYPTSWFGEPDVNTIHIDRTYQQEGIIEIAMTRVDGNNVSGYGTVAYIIGIIDDIAGLKIESDINISKVIAIDNLEKRQPLSTPVVEFRVIGKDEGEEGGLANGIFTVYPNPTSDWVTVGSRHGFEPEELRLISMSGQELSVPQQGNNRISLEGVPAGTYILRIKSGKTQVHKFIVRQ
jgi:hypothetical protein